MGGLPDQHQLSVSYPPESAECKEGHLRGLGGHGGRFRGVGSRSGLGRLLGTQEQAEGGRASGGRRACGAAQAAGRASTAGRCVSRYACWQGGNPGWRVGNQQAGEEGRVRTCAFVTAVRRGEGPPAVARRVFAADSSG